MIFGSRRADSALRSSGLRKLLIAGVVAAAVSVAAAPAAPASSATGAQAPVTDGPALLYGGTGSTCFWRVGAIGVEDYNIAYPDAGAHYWGAIWTHVPGSTLRLKGQFPYARYTSLNAYDRLGAIQDTISDFQWNPDKGSSNPFRPGVRRDVAKRNYTLTLSPGQSPVAFDPNRRSNLPARNTIYTEPAGGDTIRGIAIRVYIPNKGKNIEGGVSLPKPELTLADGTVLTGQAACAALGSETAQALDPSALLLSAEQYDALRYQPGKPDYFPALADGKTNWRVQYNRQYLLNLFRPEADPMQGATKLGQAGFFPNGDNQYVRNAINRKFGKVYALRGKIGTTAKTFTNPKGKWKATDLRYQSFCMNESPKTTRVMDCVYDEEVPLRAGGKYLVVTSRAVDKPKNATAKCGVAWIEWSPRGDGGKDTDFGWMQIRNMLPAAGFKNAIQGTKTPGDEKKVLGAYLPDSKYYADKKAFEKLGCPAK